MKHKNTIPGYVSSWTDKYFHQSVFAPLVGFPSKRVINFLARFKKTSEIELYRGIDSYNKDSDQITSRTYDVGVARRYAGEKGGEIIHKNFYLNRFCWILRF